MDTNTKLLRQKKLSYWLKGMTIVLAILLLLLFSALTLVALYMKTELPGMLWSSVFFMWGSAILCYVVLIRFWMVCTQIGRDNSFSMENVKSFHMMAVCGIVTAADFAARIGWLWYARSLTQIVAAVLVAEVLLALMFAILTEALSRLIENAYEMKHENDLTI